MAEDTTTEKLKFDNVLNEALFTGNGLYPIFSLQRLDAPNIFFTET